MQLQPGDLAAVFGLFALPVGLVMLAAAVVFLSNHWVLRSTSRTDAGTADEGMVRVSGTARAEEPLTAPSGTEAVAYEYRSAGSGEDSSIGEVTPFRVVDATGAVRVDPGEPEPTRLGDITLGDAETVTVDIEALPGAGSFGFVDALPVEEVEIEERRIEPGEEVTVVGPVETVDGRSTVVDRRFRPFAVTVDDPTATAGSYLGKGLFALVLAAFTLLVAGATILQGLQ